MDENIKPRRWGWLMLFASTGTLLCCALPILLVSVGMGAVAASLASNVPFLITLSLYKAWVFAGSGLLLIAGGWALFRPARSCPTDPEVAALCAAAHSWNQRLYWSSVGVWGIGFFFAFIAVHVFY